MNISFKTKIISSKKIISWEEAATEYNGWARSESERLSKIYKDGKRDERILSGLFALTGMVSLPASAGGAALFFAPKPPKPGVILLPQKLDKLSDHEKAFYINKAEKFFGEGRVDYSNAFQTKPVDLTKAFGVQVTGITHSRPKAVPQRPIDSFSGKPRRSVLEVGPHTPLDPKYHWVFPPETITHSGSVRDRWQIPTSRSEPFPRNVAGIAIGDRQAWLRSYYRANPAAAQQARSEARTIIDWARKNV